MHQNPNRKTSKMPLFHPKTNEAIEPLPEIVDSSSSDEEGFVKVDIKSTHPSRGKEGDSRENETEFRILTISEFLAELERLCALPAFRNKQRVVNEVVDNIEGIDGALENPEEEPEGNHHCPNQKEGNGEEEEDQEQSASLTASPAPSWDSEFCELSYMSDDSIWDSFYSSRSQPPEFQYPVVEVPCQATESCECAIEEYLRSRGM
jgi:hypothetical protein